MGGGGPLYGAEVVGEDAAVNFIDTEDGRGGTPTLGAAFFDREEAEEEVTMGMAGTLGVAGTGRLNDGCIATLITSLADSVPP